SQPRQRFRYFLASGFAIRLRGHADDLEWRARRIGQRPQQIEDRPHAQFTAYYRHPLGCGVMQWREHKAEADLVKDFGDSIRLQQARMVSAKPASSSSVSPLLASAMSDAAICASVAASLNIASSSAAASARVRSCLAISLLRELGNTRG